MPHLALRRKDGVSSFRKIAIGTWRTAYDPQVYGTLNVRMDEAIRYIEEFRRVTGRRLTVSHLLAKATAAALAACPDANAVLRWNRIYQRERIGIFFQVVMLDQGSDKADLSGATLYDVDQKSLLRLCDEFEEKVSLVRARKDKALEQTRSLFLWVPYLLLNTLLRVVTFLTLTLNLDLRRFGLPNDPFGSAMITNVGPLGLDVAYAPLVPYSGVPFLLAVGAVEERPVVEGGAVVVAKMMSINATFDHRVVDGFHASVMSKVLRAWLERPFEHFDAIEGLPAPGASAGAA